MSTAPGNAADTPTTPTKLMYAARADEAARPALHEALLDPDLRDRLAGAGVVLLQVNLDDDAVAPALRLPATTPGVAAVVSVWLDPTGSAGSTGSTGSTSAADDVTAVLTALGHDWAGWRVEERTPIPPPEGTDGERMDTLANIAMLRRPAELTHDEWLHNWLVLHTPVAIDTQGTFGYLQNVVVETVTRGSADVLPVAALVEELFPAEAMRDIHAFYGSGGDQAELDRRMTAMMNSVARFGADRDLDLVPTSRYSWTLGTE